MPPCGTEDFASTSKTITMELPPDIPPEAAAFLQEIGYLDDDRLHLGDASPQLALAPLQGGASIVIGATGATHPTILVFGSYT